MGISSDAIKFNRIKEGRAFFSIYAVQTVYDKLW